MSLSTKATSVTTTLVAVRVVNRLGAFAMGFLGVRLVRDLGADLATASAVLTAFGLCTIPSRLLGGFLGRRHGTRTAMIAGLVGCAAAQFVIGVGPSLPVVVAGALLLGLAYEIIEPPTQALLADSLDAERRAGGFALLWSAVAVAGVLAGVLAAVLAPLGVGALFLADAATSCAAAALVAAALPRPVPHPPPGEPSAGGGTIERALLVWTAVGCLYATLFMITVFLLPLAVQASGRTPATTGWLLAVAAAAGLPAQRLVARWGRARPPATLLTIGYLTFAAGLGAWALGTLPALVVGAAGVGASGTLLVGTQQAIASRLAPAGGTMTAMTVYGLSWGAGTVAAPVVGAPLLAHGPGVLWGTCSAAALCLAAGHALLMGRHHAHP